MTITSMVYPSAKAAFVALILGIVAASISWPVLAAGSGGGGGNLSNIPTNSRAATPEQQSEKAFRSGIKLRDKAIKQEAKAKVAKNR